MAKHTAGKLRIVDGHDVRTEGGETLRLSGVALSCDSKAGVPAANDRRIVACWNALVRLPTPTIERLDFKSMLTLCEELVVEMDGVKCPKSAAAIINAMRAIVND